MKAQGIILILLVSFLLSCGSLKTDASPVEIQKLDNFITEQEFMIESYWALPLTTNAMISLQNVGLFPPGSSASQIDITGTSNYFKMIGDSISAELPYFGEVQMSSGHYGGEAGIKINSKIEDYEIEKNEKSQSYKLTFNVNGETEGYKVFLTMFPNGRSSLRINGNNRFPIEYTGNFMPIEENATKIK